MTKRRKPRFEVHRLTHLSYGRDRFLDAEGLNISRTRMLCRTTEPIDVDAHVSCTLGTPTLADEWVSCDGKVSRCDQQPDNSYEVALTFNEIDVAAEPLFAALLHD